MTFNRREFLKYAALSSTSLAFGLCRSKEEEGSALSVVPNTNPDKKIGVALVGLGYYSSQLLAPALQLTNHCYLAGIVTGSPNKIPRWQEQYGIKDSNVYNYENMHTIANNDEIDVVYIVVPTGLHAKYAIRAAETGKHVWCEKPMAMNVKECQDIIQACEKNKVKLSIGYRMQHEPNTQTVIGYAKSKPYGNITGVRALAGYAGGAGGRSWRFKKDMGGGALYDMGVYAINAIRYSTGQEPISVESAQHIINRPAAFKEVDETTEFELMFTGGLKAYGRTSVGESINELRVDCANGWYSLSPLQTYSGVRGRTSDGKLLDKYIQNQQAQQMDDDALAILENKAVMVPGEEGVKDIHIVRGIFQAAETGQPVKL